jgi:hypothetical protein
MRAQRTLHATNFLFLRVFYSEEHEAAFVSATRQTALSRSFSGRCRHSSLGSGIFTNSSVSSSLQH